jgi:hypothetical protein
VQLVKCIRKLGDVRHADPTVVEIDADFFRSRTNRVERLLPIEASPAAKAAAQPSTVYRLVGDHQYGATVKPCTLHGAGGAEIMEKASITAGII